MPQFIALYGGFFILGFLIELGLVGLTNLWIIPLIPIVIYIFLIVLF